jgi:4-amino-4-deoxy-L-arabinose transferase-like glycosyltransferase
MGGVLYRDVYVDHYGPFSTYLNAFLFKMFGVNIMTLAFFNMGLVVVITYCIYRFFRHTTNSVTAMMTAATFLSIFAFKFPNYNYITPYAYALTHGIALSLFSILAFYQYIKKQNTFWVVIIGLLIGTIFLTKLEVFFASIAAIGIGFIIVWYVEQFSIRRIIKVSGILFFSLLLPTAFFTIYFSFFMPFQEALLSILTQYRQLFETAVTSNAFYLTVTGRNASLFSLGRILLVTGCYLFLFFLVWSIARLVERVSRPYYRMTIMIVAGAAVLFLLLFGNNVPWNWLDIRIPFAFQVVVAVMGIFYGISIWKSRKDKEKVSDAVPMFVFIIFAFVMLWKVILRVTINVYGFALTMPTTLVVIAGLVYHVPRLVAKSTQSTTFIRALCIILVATFLVMEISVIGDTYLIRNYPIATGKERIITDDAVLSVEGPVIDATLKKIKETIKRDENFLVIPEGILLNYLTRRDNPSPYTSFLLGDLAMHREEKMVERLSRRFPDYVILIDRSVGEWGFKKFGVDTGTKISGWVIKNYVPIYTIGNIPFQNSPSCNGVIIAKRGTPDSNAWKIWP